MSGTAPRTFAGGRYRVERTLGRGGMATVFLAEDAELGRQVAVKVLDDRFDGDAAMARRFRREARRAASLQHQNVVAVYDAGEEDGRLFIVMECVPGEGLDAVLAREGRLAPDLVLGLARQAAAGLGYAHEAGVVHRDVKPANLLVRADGVLKVTDFGIALPLAGATRLTEVGTILGTAAYLAPEQVRGEEAGPEADVFALGVVLYEALAGRVPWPVEGLASLPAIGQAPPPPLSSVAPGTPPPLERAIGHALAPDPDDRPPDAEAFHRELAGDGASDATVALPDPAVPATEVETALLGRGPKRYRGRRSAPLAVVVLVLAAAAVGLAIWLASPGEEGGPAGGAGAQAQVERIPAAEDAAAQAEALERWIRDHTAGGR
jgi:serine/threonine-protein kinase